MNVSRTLFPLVLVIAGSILFPASEASATITSSLTIYPSNPHYFVNSGQPIVILGAGQPLPNSKTDDYRAVIDDMAAHGVNYGRVWHLLVWDATNAYMPWARDGGGTAKDGLPKYNLTHWDSNFWSRLRDACAYAQSKNVYLCIMLFDECGIEAPTSSSDHRWDWHPFNPANNVNGLSLPSGDAVPEFYSLANATLKSLQSQYVSKLISETSGYPNVIYEICNEYTGPWDWEQYWAGYVAARCSNMISANRLRSVPSGYWSDPDIDVVKFHWSTTSASTTNSNMVSYMSKSKPIIYDETPEKSGITYIEYRKMVWACFVGGGHVHLENGYNPGQALDAIMYARNFITSNNVHFWEMSPNNSLVTSSPGGSAYTLAKPGAEYVTYIQGSGSGSMTISLAPGVAYVARAYNPSNGVYTNLTVSGNKVSGIPSYSSDIVTYIKASGQPVTDNPNITLSLAVDKLQALPGETLAYTLTYKNTAAGQANSVSISCPIPIYTAYVNASAGSGGIYDSAAKAVKWTLPAVAPGAGGVLTFKVKVD